jgi:CDP-glycerol glycerophosphotransferase (TagB/SpsB family)
MDNYSLMLNNIIFSKNTLKLDLAAVYPSDGFVPKVDAVFEQSGQTRRLPVSMTGNYKRKQDGMSVAVYSYSFLMDYIFFGEKKTDDISLTFEIRSGNSGYEKTGFCVSDSIVLSCRDKDIDKKYIAGKEFEGVCSFTRQEESENEDEAADDFLYGFTPCPEDGKVIITISESAAKTGNGVFSGIMLKFSLVLAVIGCVLLLPYFIIDGILAGLKIIPEHKAPVSDSAVKNIIYQIKANIATFLKSDVKDSASAMKLVSIRDTYYERYYKKMCRKPIVQNRVSFISGRRDEIGGNEKFVYDIIKDNPDIEFKFFQNSDLDRYSHDTKKKAFYELYATSKVVVVDDFYNMLNTVEKRDGVTLIQLWHACGAFKTFGFTRLGKPGGPKQKFMSHRMYDYATVSSENIADFYAEGFGVSDEKIVPTGVPRTDIFFDDEYAEKIRNDFYARYPHLKDKKIVMFAPTFRGWGQLSAFYPLSVFSPEKFVSSLGDDYALIIKLHPFCAEKFAFDSKFSDRIIDLSDEDEINDLLFVTDVLITDYSSCIFEASLLDIPMLFYAFDLYKYISDRDFYCDYESFVPGKTVFDQEQLTEAILKSDFETEKIEPFRKKYFSYTDGKSSQRAADIILKALNL